MEPETQPTVSNPSAEPESFTSTPAAAEAGTASLQPTEPERPYLGLKWMFIGEKGLRAGWSLLVFLLIFFAVATGLGPIFVKLNLLGARGNMTPRSAFFGELLSVIAMLVAAAIVARIERRSILDYNLNGPRRAFHFVSGLGVGFAALSMLVGGLYWGHWLQFGSLALSGSQIFKYAAIWACVFLLVGLFEEGMMRCYALFTLARGLSFWWASAIVGVVCIRLALYVRGNGVWGAYAIALLGVVPCLLLHLKRHPDSGFWQASWVTSTLFGAGHTGNSGEAWIGIFAAAAIGFVFCVSVKLTGSAWWAIGCHASWDWAETYFYGAADSGSVARGHLLTTNPAGNPLWSGGTVGPEGSLLVLAVIVLMLALLLVLYGRRPQALPMPVNEQLAS
jgi:membrane protease YdiL (CAAX protease family)